MPPASRPAAVVISHPDKVLWPDDGYTKADLIRFYDLVFPKLAPFVRDRLLTLERCPDGLRGDCFFQKEKPAGLPEGTPTRRILHARGLTNYVVGGRKETQLALANLGCIAVHVWASRARAPRKPDWICFDLDPATGRFSDAVSAALVVKEAIDALKLVSFPKTSGGKGLHVFIPIRTGPDADTTLRFAQRLGEKLSAAYPKKLTMESRIRERGARVYLDPFRNAFGQTVVAPYSVRRHRGAPVSTPLRWSDVKPGLDPGAFTIETLPARSAPQGSVGGLFRGQAADRCGHEGGRTALTPKEPSGRHPPCSIPGRGSAQGRPSSSWEVHHESNPIGSGGPRRRDAGGRRSRSERGQELRGSDEERLSPEGHGTGRGGHDHGSDRSRGRQHRNPGRWWRHQEATSTRCHGRTSTSFSTTI